MLLDSVEVAARGNLDMIGNHSEQGFDVREISF
jgi:hypothetical protein